MERVLQTVTAGIAVVTLIYALLLPGGVARRCGVGLGAACLGMAVFLGGMGLCSYPLAAGYLQPATALGLLAVFLTVDLPTRWVVWMQGVEVTTARGVTMFGMCVATFVAAAVAGPSAEMRAHAARQDAARAAATAGQQSDTEAEVARGRP